MGNFKFLTVLTGWLKGIQVENMTKVTVFKKVLGS